MKKNFKISVRKYSFSPELSMMIVWLGLVMLSSAVFGLISCPSPLSQLHWRHSSAAGTWGCHLWRRHHFFLSKHRLFHVGGEWSGARVYLEASSQYQFVSEGGGSEEHPPERESPDGRRYYLPYRPCIRDHAPTPSTLLPILQKGYFWHSLNL